MSESSRQTTTLWIEQRLKAIAEDRHSSTHDLMLEAIAEYVDREEKRSCYRKEALVTWQEYQETGEHITADETIAWLESWGTKHEQNVPECHR